MNAPDSSIYQHMQAAVDIVNDSQHPTNKVAATVANGTKGEGFAISRTNQWPDAIANTIGTDTDIGNSSGTIHAETTCILAATKTAGASLFITDPPCPNCMKNMAEAGITNLYIDHKGFDKDWAKRRGDSFENMSMRIAARAGMNVFVIYRKEQKYEIISEHPPGYKPEEVHPAIIEPCDNWEDAIAKAKKTCKDEPFALALTTNENGETHSILVDRHPTIGYTTETVESKRGKYSFILQPLNRLLMTASKEGLSLNPEYIYSSRVPTSRELVNFVSAGFQALSIGDKVVSRDEFGLKALEQLQKANLLRLC